MAALEWLFARPIAHRGLHDRSRGVVENTPSAVARALDHGYAVEVDVRETADGEAVVIHDATLERLTEGVGRVADSSLAALKAIPLRGTDDRLWTLEECLDLVHGRQALVVEIKAPWAKDGSFAARVARRVAARGGPAAVKTFNPKALLAAREAAPGLARGIIGEAFSARDPAWRHLTAYRRDLARNLRHIEKTRPDFVSWDVGDVDRRAVAAARAAGLPVMAWTVRGPGDAAKAAPHADQIVFEGFLPALPAAQNR